MSVAIEVEKPTVDASYHVCIRWRSRISLQPIKPEWELSFPGQDVPLAGVWRLLVSHTLNDGLVLSFNHGNLELARSGPEIVTWCWVPWERGNHEQLVNEHSWEPNHVPEVNDKGDVLDGWKLAVQQWHIERVVCMLWGDEPEALSYRDYSCELERKEKYPPLHTRSSVLPEQAGVARELAHEPQLLLDQSPVYQRCTGRRATFFIKRSL